MVELGTKRGIIAICKIGLGQLIERSDQGLRHISPAIFAPISPFVWFVIRHTFFAFLMNASSFFGSFLPGEDSTPLATSTANGRTVRIAPATFSEIRPPAR